MPSFFHVPSTPTEGHPASLLWSRGGPVAATRPPDLPPPVLDWPGAYSLTKPDGGGSSALLTQRVGVQDSAQTFVFRGGEPPLPRSLCRSSNKPLSGPCQALSPPPCSPFLPSANIPAPSTLDAGNPNGTGSAPTLGSPNPGHLSYLPLLWLRHKVRPQGPQA